MKVSCVYSCDEMWREFKQDSKELTGPTLNPTPRKRVAGLSYRSTAANKISKPFFALI
jgi:hypothetical protein